MTNLSTTSKNGTTNCKNGDHRWNKCTSRSWLTNSGEREGGPVEAVDVLSGESRVLGSTEVVDPVVCAEPYSVADGEVETSVPVNQHQDCEHHLKCAIHIFNL